jgi:hypothetical protein
MIPLIEHNHIQSLNIKMTLLQHVYQIYILTLGTYFCPSCTRGSTTTTTTSKPTPGTDGAIHETTICFKSNRKLHYATNCPSAVSCFNMCPLYNMLLYEDNLQEMTGSVLSLNTGYYFTVNQEFQFSTVNT